MIFYRVPNESLLYPSAFQCDGTETNLTDCITSPRGALTNDSTTAYITCLKSEYLLAL